MVESAWSAGLRCLVGQDDGRRRLQRFRSGKALWRHLWLCALYPGYGHDHRYLLYSRTGTSFDDIPYLVFIGYSCGANIRGVHRGTCVLDS